MWCKPCVSFGNCSGMDWARCWCIRWWSCHFWTGLHRHTASADISQVGSAQNVLCRQNFTWHLVRILGTVLQLHLNPVHQGLNFWSWIRVIIALNTTPNSIPDIPHVLYRFVDLCRWSKKTLIWKNGLYKAWFDWPTVLHPWLTYHGKLQKLCRHGIISAGCAGGNGQCCCCSMRTTGRPLVSVGALWLPVAFFPTQAAVRLQDPLLKGLLVPSWTAFSTTFWHLGFPLA